MIRKTSENDKREKIIRCPFPNVDCRMKKFFPCTVGQCLRELKDNQQKLDACCVQEGE